MKTQYLVVAAYDIPGAERGTVLSAHSTYEHATAAMHRHAHHTALRIDDNRGDVRFRAGDKIVSDGIGNLVKA